MYPTIPLPDDASELSEQLGSKKKFWCRIKEQRYLFKVGRQGTGENWAEKVAAELANLLGVPHALYDLAVCKGEYGVLSPAIVPPDGRLILGNELLAELHTDYPLQRIRNVSDHTLPRIHALLSREEVKIPIDWQPSNLSIQSAFDVFIGYLLFDAWIANQDRHHENWGLINYNGVIHLAPTYDHAASMGQNETDANRRERLDTRDQGRHINSYIKKARSAIYAGKNETKPLLTIDAFNYAAHRRPRAAKFWLDRLKQINITECRITFEQLPVSVGISEVGIDFSLTLLRLNRDRLLQHEVAP
ncbi:conserved hypothetical protein [Gammaproteobacteria bacterium]